MMYPEPMEPMHPCEAVVVALMAIGIAAVISLAIWLVAVWRER